MAEHRYPPVGSPDRFDQIVRRGRFLRRRRQFGVGAGASGSMAAVALAVVLMTGSPGAPKSHVVADGGEGTSTTVTTTSTTTTTAPPPPEELTVELDAAPDAITVVVTDPAQPVSGDSRQCLTVSLTGSTGDTAEAYACDDIPAVDGVVTVDLPDTRGVLIGCSATITRPQEGTVDLPTELRSTTFTMAPPSTLGAGDYTVDVSVTSGIGDGCAGTGDEAAPGAPITPGATEHSATATTTLTLT